MRRILLLSRVLEAREMWAFGGWVGRHVSEGGSRARWNTGLSARHAEPRGRARPCPPLLDGRAAQPVCSSVRRARSCMGSVLRVYVACVRACARISSAATGTMIVQRRRPAPMQQGGPDMRGALTVHIRHHRTAAGLRTRTWEVGSEHEQVGLCEGRGSFGDS